METYVHTKMRMQVFIVVYVDNLQQLETGQRSFILGDAQG